jgi:hypothetical protein
MGVRRPHESHNADTFLSRIRRTACENLSAIRLIDRRGRASRVSCGGRRSFEDESVVCRIEADGKSCRFESRRPADGVATRTEEELAKIQDGTTVIVRVRSTLSRRAVVARGPVRAGVVRACADDGECICRVEDVTKVG